MSAKFLVAGTLAGGMTLFVWGAVNHMAVPWPKDTVRMFKDDEAAVRAIREHAPENGAWVSLRGVFLVVRARPDLSAAKEGDVMAANLPLEFASNLLVALLLALVLLRTRCSCSLGYAKVGALMGLAAGAAIHLSERIWWGHSTMLTLVNFAEVVVGWGLAGLVLGALKRKLLPEAPAGPAPAPVAA
ncbi:MAG: hypothetical protein L0216_00755 [Planctomycetales bacterium]|nr:hypothetical protein [Planctomycetales bacterium]